MHCGLLRSSALSIVLCINERFRLLRNLSLQIFWVSDFSNETAIVAPQASSTMAAEVQEQVEVEVAEGCTLTEFCDKVIDLFLNEKPRVKDWRRYLVFREEWRKYRESFYRRCHSRANSEGDPVMSQKLISLCRKVKKV